MNKLKQVYSITLDRFRKDGNLVEFSVFGDFNMKTIQWDKFFICSHVGDKTTSDFWFGNDFTINPGMATFNFKSKKEAIDFLDDFKLKWELETNNILSYQREKKFEELGELGQSNEFE